MHKYIILLIRSDIFLQRYVKVTISKLYMICLKSTGLVRRNIYPDKSGREPSVLSPAAAPPPILVQRVEDVDHVASAESQLLRLHRHVVPNSLGQYNDFLVHRLLERLLSIRQGGNRGFGVGHHLIVGCAGSSILLVLG